MEAYDYREGNRLTLEPIGTDQPTTKASGQIDITIVERLAAWRGRRSQVLLVEANPLPLADSSPTTFVAKCFDPYLGSPSDAYDNDQTPAEYWAELCQTEVYAYQRLRQFQGRYLPIFYGRFRYSANSGPVDVVLLEFIKDPPLSHFKQSDFRSPDLVELHNQAIHVLNDFHSCGVYHDDIKAGNIFWNNERRMLRICDWDCARFDPPEDFASDWAYSDECRMNATLESYGIPWKVDIPPSAVWIGKDIMRKVS